MLTRASTRAGRLADPATGTAGGTTITTRRAEPAVEALIGRTLVARWADPATGTAGGITTTTRRAEPAVEALIGKILLDGAGDPVPALTDFAGSVGARKADPKPAGLPQGGEVGRMDTYSSSSLTPL